MKRSIPLVLLVLLLVLPASAQLPRTPAPEGARVYIITPEDGATLKSPVTVRFGLSGMGVAPAGVEKATLVQYHGQLDHGYQAECVRRYPGRFCSVVELDRMNGEPADIFALVAVAALHP